jgi:MSHA biogenesis protein MshI
MRLPTLSSLFKRTSRSSGWFAICVNSNGAYLAQAKYGGDKPQVLKCSFHPATSVTSSFLEKLRKDERVGNFQFVTLLPSGDYQISMVEAPNVPVEEFKTAVRWRIKDTLSYPVDSATVEVLQIPAGKTGGDRPKSLFAIAAPNDTVHKRIALFEKAKIGLQVIDIPEMAQRNIAALFEEGERGLALLAFDDNGGMLTITSEGELYLARRIEITAGQLQDANENQRQQYLDRVELELQRSMDYFGRQFSYISVKRMLVSAPEQTGLARLLTHSLDVPVEQMDLAQVLDISAAPELADSEFAAHALSALGAALRNEGRAS